MKAAPDAPRESHGAAAGAAVHQRVSPGRGPGDGHGGPVLPRRRGPNQMRVMKLTRLDLLARFRRSSLRLSRALLCGARRIKLTVAYDGTNYAGWQRQLNAKSVQETLKALSLDGRRDRRHRRQRTDGRARAGRRRILTRARAFRRRSSACAQHPPARRHPGDRPSRLPRLSRPL